MFLFPEMNIPDHRAAPPAVSCPQCGKQTLWRTENVWRPFCCERCKAIDMGNWAGERYRFPEETRGDDSEFALESGLESELGEGA